MLKPRRLHRKEKPVKFKAEKEKLLALIDHASGVIEKRNTIPILSNIMLIAEDGRLAIVATDLDLTVHDEIDAVDIATPGRITVNSQTFSSLLRKMPQGNISIRAEDGRMHIVSGRISYKIPTLPADDYPHATGPDGSGIEIETADVERAFRLVRSFMSTEETRYYLNGAYLAVENGLLVAVATDGHRMSVAKIADNQLPVTNVIVPRKTVAEVLKIISGYDGKMLVTLDERKIEMQIGKLTITSKLVDGTYPEYQRVIPTKTDITIKVEPKVLAEAIDRVNVVSTEKTRAVEVVARDGVLFIRANNPDTGNAEEEVPADVSAPIRVGYNGRYLLDVLMAYSDKDQIIISMMDAGSPALIVPYVGSVDRSILMPMRI